MQTAALVVLHGSSIPVMPRCLVAAQSLATACCASAIAIVPERRGQPMLGGPVNPTKERGGDYLESTQRPGLPWR